MNTNDEVDIRPALMDLERSKMIGDHVCDLYMGINKGYQELMTYDPHDPRIALLEAPCQH